MIVTLPWPSSRLSPNARLHWASLAAAKRKAKADASAATMAACNGGMREVRMSFRGIAPIPLTITFYPPDNRRRDRDNMQFAMKAALDGVAEALGVDDYRFHPSYAFAAAEKPGRVEITL